MGLFHFKFRSSLTLLSLLGSLALCVVGGIALLQFSDTGKHWNSYRAEVVDKLHYLSQIRADMGYGGAIHTFKNYVLRGGVKYQKEFELKTGEILEDLEGYRKLGNLSEIETAAIVKIEEMVEQYRQKIDLVASFHQKGVLPSDIDAKVKVNDAPFLRAIQELEDQLRQRTELKTGFFTKQLDDKSAQVLMLVIASLLITLVLGTLISKRIANRLEREVGRLLEVSSELSSRAANQLSNFDSQSNLADGVSVLVSQLAVASKDGVDYGARVNQIATSALEKCKDGQEAVVHGQQLTENIKQLVEEIVTLMLELNWRSQEINLAVDVIKELAEQTKILSYNAAIEAAAAGEAGRGFGVIADHVGNLAELAKNASRDVQSLVGVIQVSADGTVKKTEQAFEVADEGLKVQQQVVNIINSVLNQMNDVRQLFERFTSSNVEQSSAIDMVNHELETLDSSVKKNQKLFGDLLETAESLNNTAHELESM